MLRVLTLTSLFPNAAMPRHGVFVLERLRQLVRRHPVEVTAVAPVPWFPSAGLLPDRYAAFGTVPRREEIEGFTVHHPRFLAMPGLGSATNPLTFAHAAGRCIRSLDPSRFDLIDSHYAFPDGAGAVLLGRRFSKPVAVTVRGSDIHVHGRERLSGWWLRRTLQRADTVIAVSDSLAEGVTSLAPQVSDRVRVLRNGVDMDRFSIRGSRAELKESLGWHGTTLLSVGNLVRLKGHDLGIQALRDLPGASLVVVGSGPEERPLRRLATEAGVAERVVFAGTVSQSALIDMYNAADVVVLASSSEGMPNVVLESLACGTPVVATDVSDNASLLRCADAGRIMSERSSGAIADGVRAVLAAAVPRERVRRQAERFDWAGTCDGIMQTFEELAGASDRARRAAGQAP